MKLSFCIPTYNRCKFLGKSIKIIIRQIRELSVENEVEILVSDNGSPDKTEALCQEFIANNPDIHIEYHKNAINEGPDWNFIKAMRLAHGEYSILFGDDDFLMDDALKKILDLIEDKKISIFASNRICINSLGEEQRKQIFLDIPSDYKIFDFSNEDSMRSFFYGVKSLGGILTFISSVVYKTDILDKYPFNEKVIGSNYAFLYYWWSELLGGGKLYFMKCSLVQATVEGATNNNYGKMVNRAMVDYVGIPTVVNEVTQDKVVRQYFYRTIDLDHPFISMQELYVKEKKKFEQILEPTLLSLSWCQEDIKWVKYSASPKRAFSILYHAFKNIRM